MDVKYVDSFLDKIDFKKVKERTVDASWTLQCSDPTNKDNMDFLYLDVSNEEFYNKYLFDKVKQYLDGEYKLERIYFNGHGAEEKEIFIMMNVI